VNWRVRLVSLASLVLAGPLLSQTVETGTHWAAPRDFVTLKNIGYQFVVTTVSNNPANWRDTFDAAEANGLRLIVGLADHTQYRLNTATGAWTISATGEAFLRYAALRSTLVKAIFVFNEPYWVDPWTNQNNTCGALSAAQLRRLRTALRGVWPEARVFHDIGAPRLWAPGAQLPRDYPCIGTKYADQQGVADFVGIWFYPFESSGYRKAEALAALRADVDFVRQSMGAEPVIDAQSFICKSCQEATRWPTAEEIQDWNCAVRGLQPAAISWYVWQQDLYNDYLANHPDHWTRTTAASCQAAPAPEPVPRPESIASAAAMDSALPVAPGAIISIFGGELAPAVKSAGPAPLPRQIDGITVLVNRVAAPLYFVAQTQINAQVPFETAPGEATLVVQRGGQVSSTLRLRVSEAAPAVFTWTQDGRGLAVAVDGLTNQLLEDRNPAAPGSVVVIYGTGFGPMTPAAATGDLVAGASPAVNRVTAAVAGLPAEVLYAGATPGFAGLYQVNVRIPTGASRGRQPLRLTQAGQTSNLAQLPIL